jgi:hypothetical protein
MEMTLACTEMKDKVNALKSITRAMLCLVGLSFAQTLLSYGCASHPRSKAPARGDLNCQTPPRDVLHLRAPPRIVSVRPKRHPQTWTPRSSAPR